MKIEDIIKWGCEYLSSHGYTLISNLPETVQDTPWSYVVRFATSDGYIYLKHTPALLALEATITQVLYDQFHGQVPEIIARNVELNSFLMKDAGDSLREILKHKFDEALLCKAIDQFTTLQLAVSNHVDIFLNMGVPDWRLDKLLNLYMQLLSQKDILLADGLTEKEINDLKHLLPVVANLCKKLSCYAIKETMVQPDFHDNNILINNLTKNITIIDLGEIIIAHPFVSLENCLQQIQKQHALKETEDIYLRIKDACFKNFINVESKKNLLTAFEIVKILYFIYGALGNYRLIIACDKAKFTSAFKRHGRCGVPLKEFMAVCNTMDK